MLEAYRTGALSLALTALLGIASTGCGAIEDGTHDTTVHFLAEPSNGAFAGWSDITLDGNISSVGTTVLWGITLSVEMPAEADLSFLSTLTAAAAGQTVATLDSFPRGEQSALMNITYFQDLHPLFETSSTIRINWAGTTNPDFQSWPSGGIWLQADIKINVE
jgi:hypothetical protein